MINEEDELQQVQAKALCPKGGFLLLVSPEGATGFSIWAYDDTELTPERISEMHVFYQGAVELLSGDPLPVFKLGEEVIREKVEALSKEQGDNVVEFKPKGTVH